MLVLMSNAENKTYKTTEGYEHNTGESMNNGYLKVGSVQFIKENINRLKIDPRIIIERVNIDPYTLRLRLSSSEEGLTQEFPTYNGTIKESLDYASKDSFCSKKLICYLKSVTSWTMEAAYFSFLSIFPATLNGVEVYARLR